MPIKFIREIILMTFFMLCFLHCSAKNKKEPFYISSSYYFGVTLPHHPNIEYLVKDHVKGYEIAISKPTVGKKYWEELYRLPEYGAGIYYGSLGNKEVFGNALAVFGFFNPSIIKSPRFKLNYKMGLGVSYITKCFNLRTNTYNISIGSHINAYFRFDFNTKFKLHKNIYLNNSLSFSHMSNGKIKSPNQGLNNLLFSMGFQYLFNDHKNLKTKIKNPEKIKKYYLHLYSAYSSKTINHYEQGRYDVFTLNASYYYRLNLKRSIGLGLDFFYDNSVKKRYKLEENKKASFPDVAMTGLHICQDLIIDKFSVTLQLGYYLYAKRKKEIRDLYQRYGIKYSISNNIFTIVALKTHLGKADFVEWGIGLNL